MAGGTAVPVFAARVDSCVCIRPEGPVTVAVCPTLSAALCRWRDEGVSRFHFDLSQAEWIDSTFTGLLVSLVTRENRGRIDVRIVSPAPGALQALEDMHVSDLFAHDAQLPAGELRWFELEAVAADATHCVRQVVCAHEHLIEADARNEAVFSPVVKLLRTRLNTPSPDQASGS